MLEFAAVLEVSRWDFLGHFMLVSSFAAVPGNPKETLRRACLLPMVEIYGIVEQELQSIGIRAIFGEQYAADDESFQKIHKNVGKIVVGARHSQ
eukprot:COSAG03_NODE_2848_length_2408_cov_32.196104_3_plen_94_part_00